MKLKERKSLLLKGYLCTSIVSTFCFIVVATHVYYTRKPESVCPLYTQISEQYQVASSLITERSKSFSGESGFCDQFLSKTIIATIISLGCIFIHLVLQLPIAVSILVFLSSSSPCSVRFYHILGCCLKKLYIKAIYTSNCVTSYLVMMLAGSQRKLFPWEVDAASPALTPGRVCVCLHVTSDT